jgi:hypothetical protein
MVEGKQNWKIHSRRNLIYFSFAQELYILTQYLLFYVVIFFVLWKYGNEINFNLSYLFLIFPFHGMKLTAHCRRRCVDLHLFVGK